MAATHGSQGHGKGSRTEDAVGVWREYTVRYFRFEKPGEPSGISYSLNGIHITATEQDNLVEEHASPETGIPTGLRIRALNQPEITFNATTVDYYKSVQAFDLASPASIHWVFQWISCLPVLKCVRFTDRFFYECKEDTATHRNIKTSPTVQELLINFDMLNFRKQEKRIQQKAMNKLDNFLSLVPKYLTGLKFLDLTLPEGPSLNTFLKSVPDLQRKGVKAENFEDGVFTFRSTIATVCDGLGQTRKRQGSLSLQKSEPAGASKGARPSCTDYRAGPSQSSEKKIRINSESTSVAKVKIEIIDISGDEDIPDDIKPEIPPQRATNDQSSVNGFKTQPKVKRNRRGSSSLLGGH